MAARWYVVNVRSSCEKKVAASLNEQIVLKNMAELIQEVMVPTEEVLEIKKGKKVSTERKFFPGYILVKMELNDETWHMVKNTPNVSGFLGGRKPQAITEEEANRILTQVQDGVDRPKAGVSFDIGEEVRVIDGPFSSFIGLVEDIDNAKGKIKVSVSIFGRATPVELEFSQVEKQ